VTLATVGLGLLSIRGWSVGVGELLILACAFCFGAHIISLGKWSRGRDAYAMTVIQLAMCTVITGLGSVAEGGYSPPPDWGSVGNSGIYCSCLHGCCIHGADMVAGAHEYNKGCCHSYNGSCLCSSICHFIWRR